MNTLQKFAIVLVIATCVICVGASPANAQVSYGNWLPAVPSYTEPYMVYHPFYQPARSTYYVVPQTYYRPYPYSAYTYDYPMQTYYYTPTTMRVRPMWRWWR